MCVSYLPVFPLYSSVFILYAYITPFLSALWPLLFLCANLPACPPSRFLTFCPHRSVVLCLCVCCFVVWPVDSDCTLCLSLSVSQPPWILEFHLERAPLLTSTHPPELAGQWFLTNRKIKVIQQPGVKQKRWHERKEAYFPKCQTVSF